MGQIPENEALTSCYVSISTLPKTRVIIVGHTYRIIYIICPAHNLKNLSRSTPESHRFLIDAVEGQVPDQTSVQALRTLLIYTPR